jgi:hypothetical protein
VYCERNELKLISVDYLPQALVVISIGSYMKVVLTLRNQTRLGVMRFYGVHRETELWK